MTLRCDVYCLPQDSMNPKPQNSKPSTPNLVAKLIHCSFESGEKPRDRSMMLNISAKQNTDDEPRRGRVLMLMVQMLPALVRFMITTTTAPPTTRRTTTTAAAAAAATATAVTTVLEKRVCFCLPQHCFKAASRPIEG